MKSILKVIFLFLIFFFSANIATAQTDVILAVDKSGTMKANDPNNLRYEGAKQFLTLLSLYRDNNQAGVVAFGDNAQPVLDFGYISSDKAQKYENLLINQDTDNWTELGLGLKKSIDLLKQSSSKNKNIILLSDGIIEGNPQTRGTDKENALKKASDEVWQEIIPELRQQGIRVYSLGLFKDDRRGEETLKKIASETGGEYKKIDKPEEFSDVYLDMLNRIEPPAREENFTSGSKEININPGDGVIIIVGPNDFIITSKESGKTIYPDDPTSTGIQTFTLKGKGNERIVILKPKDPTQNNEWKNGLILSANSDGKLIVISNLEFEDLGDTQLRNFFFLNEIIKMKFRVKFKDDLKEEVKTYLNEIFQKGEIEYTLTPKEGGNVITGQLKQQDGNVFAEERLLDTHGNFIFDINLKKDNTLTKLASKSVSVSEMSPALIKVFDKEGKEVLDNMPLNVGDDITVEVVTNPDLSAKFSREYKGVALKKVEFYKVKNSNNLVGIPLNDLQEKDKKFVTKPTIIDSEVFVVQANLQEATLIQQVTGQNETRQIPFRAKILREIKAEKSWGNWFERWKYWIGAIASIFTVFLGFQRFYYWAIGKSKAENEIRHFVFMPGQGKQEEINFGEISARPKSTSFFSSIFKRNKDKEVSYPIVQETSTKPGIKISGLELDNDNPVFEIGKTFNGKSFIRLLDDTIIVKLAGQPLKKGEQSEFEGDTKLSIGENDTIEYVIKEEPPEKDDEIGTDDE